MIFCIVEFHILQTLFALSFTFSKDCLLNTTCFYLKFQYSRKYMPIRAIAFDLDDTLMDTTGILVPNAAKNAFQILIAAGLTLTLDECEEKRTQLVKSISHKEAFAKLAAQFGTAETIARSS